MDTDEARAHPDQDETVADRNRVVQSQGGRCSGAGSRYEQHGGQPQRG